MRTFNQWKVVNMEEHSNTTGEVLTDLNLEEHSNTTVEVLTDLNLKNI